MATGSDAVILSRRLIRAARSATLATVSAGQPFASLVTPATAGDLSPLLLLSSLAEHTGHLAADPSCALLIAGTAASANPQTTPRVTLTGTARPEPDPALKARWLARHPYAAFYAGFADFSLWRIAIGGALLVAGFGRAARIRPAELAPDPGAVARLATAEADIMAACNAALGGSLARLAGGTGAWRIVAVDPDGCDLAPAEPDQGLVRRIDFRRPAARAEDVRAELIHLLSPVRPS